MGIAIFMLFGSFVFVAGCIFVFLTLRHHRQVERAQHEQAPDFNAGL